MEIKDFVNKYWFIAIKGEQELCIPAIYLLSHMAIETKLGEQKSINYNHGEEIVILNDIKEDISNFKKFWIDLINKIKLLFKRGLKEEKQVLNQDMDNVLDFLVNSKYNPKLHYIQNLDQLAETLYDDKQELIDMVNKVKSILQELGHL